MCEICRVPAEKQLEFLLLMPIQTRTGGVVWPNTGYEL